MKIGACLLSKRIIRERLRHAVIVTLKDQTTFRGVLFAADSEALVIRNAEALMGGERAPIPVDGEVVVLRGDVLYVQIP